MFIFYVEKEVFQKKNVAYFPLMLYIYWNLA